MASHAKYNSTLRISENVEFCTHESCTERMKPHEGNQVTSQCESLARAVYGAIMQVQVFRHVKWAGEAGLRLRALGWA